VTTPTSTPTTNDPSNGFEAIAPEFMRWREQSNIGVTTIRTWARALPKGAAVLDLGCGAGAPISIALTEEGLMVYGIDASASLTAAFRRRLPNAHVACESIEDSRFFNRTFDAVIAIGLMFLLTAEAQLNLIRKVAAALNPNGQFLFSAPKQVCTWTDTLTGQTSCSLGTEQYKAAFSAANLTLIGEYVDEGGNHYFDTRALDATLSSAT
jgi:2-polyprenyl-3-methyl-5-hydroxy-6-metoxy-1,4-benzoquinol methylase